MSTVFAEDRGAVRIELDDDRASHSAAAERSLRRPKRKHGLAAARRLELASRAGATASGSPPLPGAEWNRERIRQRCRSPTLAPPSPTSPGSQK